MLKVQNLALFLLPCSFLAACSGAGTVRVEPEVVAMVDTELPGGGFEVLEADMRIAPGEYEIPVQDGEAVIVVDGQRNTVLDLRGVVLRGTPEGSAADAGRGVAVLIRGCENLEVLGGTFGGYRVGIQVENSDGITIDGGNYSPVFGMRLGIASGADQEGSGLELNMGSLTESLGEAGAAIAVIDSSRVEIRGVTVRGGQNGILLIRAENCRLDGNDCSYLSGFGIALEDSAHNEIIDNHCDRVTRRFQGVRTERDHGASGLFLLGEASNNVITGNSFRGGTVGVRELGREAIPCQGNRYFDNDLSGSSQAGILMVGSRDSWIVKNRFADGVGAGISTLDSHGVAISGNRVQGILGAGILLVDGEHGVVRGNQLRDCDVALEVQGSGESLNHWFGQNQFKDNTQDLVLEEARALEFWQNDFERSDALAHLDGLSGLDNPELGSRSVWSWLADAEQHIPSGRSFQSELRWASPVPPEMLASMAAWQSGQSENPAASGWSALSDLEMGEFGPLDPDPSRQPGNSDSQKGVLERASWRVTWFAWNQDSDPRGDIEGWRAQRFEPLMRATVSGWRDPFGGQQEVRETLPSTQFGLIASCVLEIDEAGEYLLSAISDDGVRLIIDGNVVLEDWAWHPERRRSQKIDLDVGSHPMEVEYFQMDGTAVLSLDLHGPAGH
ncbi:MAG: parallel beta-helix repeat protein [Candidatus Paceibacteria bacterium]|jgi:parallel beta-helix repeat protein